MSSRRPPLSPPPGWELPHSASWLNLWVCMMKLMPREGALYLRPTYEHIKRAPRCASTCRHLQENTITRPGLGHGTENVLFRTTGIDTRRRLKPLVSGEIKYRILIFDRKPLGCHRELRAGTANTMADPLPQCVENKRQLLCDVTLLSPT